MKKYSFGFIFTPSFEQVLLIHKLKPDWQKGKINGIGGKIEENENPLSCVAREVKEETDLAIKETDWIYVTTLSSSEFLTELFASIYSGNRMNAKSMEAEQIEWFPTNNLPTNMMNNLYWLIPLSIDKLKHNEPKTVIVKY